jgi:hypothetical protein
MGTMTPSLGWAAKAPVARLVAGRGSVREYITGRCAILRGGAEGAAGGAARRRHRRARVCRDWHLLEHGVGVAIAIWVQRAVPRQLRVPLLCHVVLLQVRHEQNPAGDVAGSRLASLKVHHGIGHFAHGIVVALGGEADLLEVVRALDASRGGTHFLDGGEEQTDQDRNDGDHDQKLDQREGRARRGAAHEAISESSVMNRSEPRCDGR